VSVQGYQPWRVAHGPYLWHQMSASALERPQAQFDALLPEKHQGTSRSSQNGITEVEGPGLLALRYPLAMEADERGIASARRGTREDSGYKCTSWRAFISTIPVPCRRHPVCPVRATADGRLLAGAYRSRNSLAHFDVAAILPNVKK
jgi:hypothetical protein